MDLSYQKKILFFYGRITFLCAVPLIRKQVTLPVGNLRGFSGHWRRIGLLAERQFAAIRLNEFSHHRRGG